MTNLLIFLCFFLAICFFLVIFVGMAIFGHLASEFDNAFEEGEIDATYYPDDEDNVIFRS